MGLFLISTPTNSLISITLRTCIHTNVTSQTIIYPNTNPNQKKLKYGSRNPNPNSEVHDRPKGRTVGGFSIRVRISGPTFEIFLLGLGYIMIYDVTLVSVHVQSVILIREPERVPGRKASP